jgi:hypothetical protein
LATLRAFRYPFATRGSLGWGGGGGGLNPPPQTHLLGTPLLSIECYVANAFCSVLYNNKNFPLMYRKIWDSNQCDCVDLSVISLAFAPFLVGVRLRVLSDCTILYWITFVNHDFLILPLINSTFLLEFWWKHDASYSLGHSNHIHWQSGS